MSLLRSAATISALTMLSRITGLVRDMLIARYFGAGAATDAFYVAFRIPNMLRRLFAEGAFSQAFVPMLSQVSSGFVIIICAIAASALGAWLFPVQEEETKAGDAQ